MHLKNIHTVLEYFMLTFSLFNPVVSELVPQNEGLSSTPLCVPGQVPSIPLPDEYSTCAEEVKASECVENFDTGKTTEEIVRHYGYSLEIHHVTTKDGYVLTIHRITGSRISPPRDGKPSVYLHHGMGGSSDNWLLQPGDRNLAFKLVNAGYDVWLGNCRGTTYSMDHVFFNSSTDVEYWDFSWHEKAIYDVPATIDLITSSSRNEKILYVGFSMGTTVYFITLSEKPEYNKKITAGFMLAPSAFDGHCTNPLRLISPGLALEGQYLLDPILQGRIDQQYKMQRLFNVSLAEICTPTAMRCGVCDNVIFAIFGFDAPQMNYTNLPNILSKFPNIISVKTLIHYEQSMNSCEFKQFDYGPLENMKRYSGSRTPPSYDLSKITAPTYFFHSDSDNLACPEDVQITQDHMLPTTVLKNFRINWELFNHVDFQWAKDADLLVYNKILELMNSHL